MEKYRMGSEGGGGLAFRFWRYVFCGRWHKLRAHILFDISLVDQNVHFPPKRINIGLRGGDGFPELKI